MHQGFSALFEKEFKIARAKLRSFEYYIEDIDCQYCVNYKGKNKLYRNGCQQEICDFFGERRKAVKNGRIEREKGWDK